MFLKSLSLIAFIALAETVAPGRAAAVLPDNFEDQLVTGGLSQPASLAFLPDGRVLVVEQRTGKVRLVVMGSLSATPALTITDLQIIGNEQGLLGVAVDPRWPSPAYAYFYFDRSPGNFMYISRFTASGSLSDSSSTNLTFGSRYNIIVDIPDDAPNHNAGTLRFGPDDMLYASLGDDADQCTAQDSTDLRGEILRMNVAPLPGSGTGPASKPLLDPGDNPFAGANVNVRITYAMGLRNPFRMSIDPMTGILYVGDVGADASEEISEVLGGENLGWPFREGYNVRIPGGCAEPGGPGSQSYDGPIDAYPHNGNDPASIIAGVLYRRMPGGDHTFPPYYDGVVFYSDYYSGQVRALKKVFGVWDRVSNAPGQPSADDWATEMAFIGDSILGPDGAIYYVKQFPGELRRIVYTGEANGAPVVADPFPLLLAPNPFRAATGGLSIDFELPEPGPTRVEVFDVQGREVVVLLQADLEGAVTARWDGRNRDGAPVAPGLYLVQISGAWGRTARRAVLLP